MFSKTSTRLNKYISESGLCSRRDADRFIEQGNVFVNGKRAQVGDQVSPGDQVKVNGQEIEARDEEALIFIALNKPIGIVSTTESSERHNIVSFVNHSTRIFPIGRLDKDSQGLIFLTNNGDLVNKILRAGNNHEKEYLVTVNKPITDAFIDGMSAGVPMMGVTTKKCKITKESPTVFRITLVQGLNRQIRRMCEHFNYDVLRLDRVRIMNVSLKGLPVGEWRDLKQQELSTLFEAIEHSSSESHSTDKSAGQSASKSAAKKTGAKKRSSSAVNNRGENNSGSNKNTSRSEKPKRSGRKPANSKTGVGAKSAGDSSSKKHGKNSAKNSGRNSSRSSARKNPKNTVKSSRKPKRSR